MSKPPFRFLHTTIKTRNQQRLSGEICVALHLVTQRISVEVVLTEVVRRIFFFAGHIDQIFRILPRETSRGLLFWSFRSHYVNLWANPSCFAILAQEVGQAPGKRNCLSCICPKHPYFPPKPSKFPYISSPYRAKLKVLDLYAHMDKFINCESTSATTFYVLLLYKLTRFSN